MFFALRVAPQARAQGTPTPTCTATPTPTATPAQCTTHENIPCETCSPTPYPDVSPTVIPIPSPFQPADGTVLEWRVFKDPVPSNGKGPAVLLLHEGHFAAGWIFSGLLDDPVEDLTKAGYYVFVAAYRQAPCGLVTGQACHADTAEGRASGRPPQQTNGMKAFIRAMKADSRCNGKFGVVGGSSGASHAAFAAFDISSSGSAWPNWNQTGDDRPLAFVCLSGAYDFTDRTPETDYPTVPGDPITEFRNKIENLPGPAFASTPMEALTNGVLLPWRNCPRALPCQDPSGQCILSTVNMTLCHITSSSTSNAS